MSIAHLLENFDLDPLNSGMMHLLHEDALEEQRLAAFEQGYSAGWEDAVTAQSEDHAHLEATLTRNLEDLSFTYHEALTQMTQSLEPMFQSLMTTVLPQTIEQGFGHHIVEQLTAMAEEQVAQPALLIVPAGAGAQLKPLLDQQSALPVQLVEEASLPPGQACLRVGTAERDVDCNAFLASITEAMDAFLYEAKEISLND
ncbi:MAG: ABC transporter ATP-binding protein [Ruegeria sp.]|uniref:ABC transporter ATP-binding protein n=1 Tax=Ruegeria sp. TaxID=1879320 RepID=UPI00349E5F38